MWHWSWWVIDLLVVRHEALTYTAKQWSPLTNHQPRLYFYSLLTYLSSFLKKKKKKKKTQKV